MSTDEWTKEKIVGGLEWAQSTLSSLDRKPTAQSDECSLLVQQATHCERPPAVAASFGTKQCTWASVAVDVLYAIDRLHSECALANLARSSIDIIPSRSLRCVRIRFPERNEEFSMFERRQKDVNKIVEECRCSLVHSLDAIQYQLCIKHMWLRALLPQHFFGDYRRKLPLAYWISSASSLDWKLLHDEQRFGRSLKFQSIQLFLLD